MMLKTLSEKSTIKERARYPSSNFENYLQTQRQDHHEIRADLFLGLQMRTSHACKCCLLKNSLGVMCNCMRGLEICAVDRGPLKEGSLSAF